MAIELTFEDLGNMIVKRIKDQVPVLNNSVKGAFDRTDYLEYFKGHYNKLALVIFDGGPVTDYYGYQEEDRRYTILIFGTKWEKDKMLKTSVPKTIGDIHNECKKALRNYFFRSEIIAGGYTDRICNTTITNVLPTDSNRKYVFPERDFSSTAGFSIVYNMEVYTTTH